MFTRVLALLMEVYKNLCHALVYTDEDVAYMEFIYLEIVRCVLTLGLGE